MSAVNRQVRLAARPTGVPGPDTWQHTEESVPSPGADQVLVRVSHLSLDPAMRGWLNAGRSYIAAVEVGAVMRAQGGGEVVESNADGIAVGAQVVGVVGAQEYAVLDAAAVRVVDTADIGLPTHLGTLGTTGLTAYFGLLDVGALREGETVLVSGAAGATGSVVGQIAKIKGCRVIGVAGGPDKCAWLTDELGFDAAVDYKAGSLPKALRAAAPDGVDVYFDNVGGDVLDAALGTLAPRGARVVICGAVSQYNATEGVRGPSNYLSLLVNRARMQGFVVFDYADRYAEGTAALTEWLRAGKITAREDVVDGAITDFGDVLLRLFTGANTGKLVLRLTS